VTIETLGQAFEAGWVAHARCNGRSRATPKSSRACLYAYELDMTTLLLTRGPSFPLERLPSRLLCPRCGAPNLSVVYFVPSERRSG
jgi:rubredoxin